MSIEQRNRAIFFPNRVSFRTVLFLDHFSMIRVNLEGRVSALLLLIRVKLESKIKPIFAKIGMQYVFL